MAGRTVKSKKKKPLTVLFIRPGDTVIFYEKSDKARQNRLSAYTVQEVLDEDTILIDTGYSSNYIIHVERKDATT